MTLTFDKSVQCTAYTKANKRCGGKFSVGTAKWSLENFGEVLCGSHRTRERDLRCEECGFTTHAIDCPVLFRNVNQT